MQHFGKRLRNLRQQPGRVLLALGALTLLGLGLAVPGLYAWSQYHFRAARQALERDDLSAASAHLERSLSTAWKNPRAQFLAARTARRRDAYAEAERLLTAYEHQQGVTPESELEWILLGVQQGDYAGRERSLQALVDQEHADALLILEALAKGYQNTFRLSEMIACLDRLLQEEPTNVPALILRGKGWESLRNPERTLEAFEHAVERAPQSSEARLGLAEALNRLGRPREAIYHYEIVRRWQPANAVALLGLARCHFDCTELAKAEQLLHTLLAGEPNHIAGLVERARLALHQGQPAAAETWLSRALTLAPWHREGQRLRLLCLETLGNAEEVRQCQERLRELESSNAQAERLRLRFRNASRDTSVRYEIGMWCLHNGQEQAGIRWLCTTLLVDPRHAPTHAALADYFERTGQPRRAAQHRALAEARGKAETSLGNGL